MRLQNAARGITEGIDDQSMRLQSVARAIRKESRISR